MDLSFHLLNHHLEKAGVVVDLALTVPVQVEPDSPDSILDTIGVEYFFMIFV